MHKIVNSSLVNIGIYEYLTSSQGTSLSQVIVVSGNWEEETGLLQQKSTIL